LPTASGWYTDGNSIKQHTSGILPAKAVTLKSIGWFGFETANYVVHGLWVRKMDELLTYIQGLGFNSIRIPWSNDIIKNPSPNGINYTLNP
jgi:endoglucanase